MSRRSATTTKVFVGSLPAGTTTEQLRELFASYGEIAECDVVNRCGFLHLEDRNLAIKAIDELNNTTFNGTRISVEKGRVKPSRREREREVSRGGGRNGYSGPMRGGRDSYRSGPYGRDGDYDRRGPPRGGYGTSGGGYDRGYSSRSASRPINDGYTNGGDRRSYMDDRSNYGNNGYGNNSGYGMNAGGDHSMYSDDYSSSYTEERRPLMDDRNSGINQRSSYERRSLMDDRKAMDDRGVLGDRHPAMNDRSPTSGGIISERRPLLDTQSPALSSSGMHGSAIPAIQSSYDRRPQTGPDMYSRRDMQPKPLNTGYGEPNRNTGYGDTSRPIGYPEPTRPAGYADSRTTGYGEPIRTTAYDASRTTGYGDPNRTSGYVDPNRPIAYDSTYTSLQQPRGFTGGPGPRRDMPPVRRF